MSSSKSVAAFISGDQLPAHLAKGAGLGNENVGANDMQIGRLDLIQQLSPQLLKSSPKFIDGAELGDIFNSLTNETYKSVFLVNLMYELRFSLFKKRKLGGGLEGNFDTAEAAHQHMETNGLDKAQYDLIETGVHKCLLLDEKGVPVQPVLVYMNGSKKGVSDKWNTQIHMKGQGSDRFATVWVGTSVQEVNKQQQPYQNWKIDFAGFASEALYAEARENYYALRGEPVPAETAA